VSQEAAPSAAAAGSKWQIIQKAIKSNVQELKAIVKPAGAEGSSAGRAYTQMAAQEATAGAAAHTSAASGAREGVSRLLEDVTE
jgi:hypothetical protein